MSIDSSVYRTILTLPYQTVQHQTDPAAKKDQLYTAEKEIQYFSSVMIVLSLAALKAVILSTSLQWRQFCQTDFHFSEHLYILRNIIVVDHLLWLNSDWFYPYPSEFFVGTGTSF